GRRLRGHRNARAKLLRRGPDPLRLLRGNRADRGSGVRNLHYHRVDVSTDRLFGGTPLAVFTNGRCLSSELMQSIARELNLSETTFVLPAEKAGTDFRVRIFTPAAELPMAGHPTIGTAFVLARAKRVTDPLV